jgi:hypothetical protein
MLWYQQSLKVRVWSIIISIKDLEDIRELIKQIIKVNN